MPHIGSKVDALEFTCPEHWEKLNP